MGWVDPTRESDCVGLSLRFALWHFCQSHQPSSIHVDHSEKALEPIGLLIRINVDCV